MKTINSEYDELFPKLKGIHQNKEGEIYTAKQATTETADQCKDLTAELMKMDGIVIEIIGCFVWVTGNTKPHKEQLNQMLKRRFFMTLPMMGFVQGLTSNLIGAMLSFDLESRRCCYELAGECDVSRGQGE